MRQLTLDEHDVSPNMLLWDPRLFSETMNHRVIKDRVRHFGSLLSAEAAAALLTKTTTTTPPGTRLALRSQGDQAPSVCYDLLRVPSSSSRSRSPSLHGSQQTAERLSRNDRWRTYPHHQHHHHHRPSSPTGKGRVSTDSPPTFRGRSSSPIPVPQDGVAQCISLPKTKTKKTKTKTKKSKNVGKTKTRATPRAPLSSSRATTEATTISTTMMLIVQDSDREQVSSTKTSRGQGLEKKTKEKKKKKKKKTSRTPVSSSGDHGSKRTTRNLRTLCSTSTPAPTETCSSRRQQNARTTHLDDEKKSPTSSPRRRGSTGPLVDLWETLSTNNRTIHTALLVPWSPVTTPNGHHVGREGQGCSVVSSMKNDPTGLSFVESWDGSGSRDQRPLCHDHGKVVDVHVSSSPSPTPPRTYHHRTTVRRGSTGTLAVRWEEELLPSLRMSPRRTVQDGSSNDDSPTSKSDHSRGPSRRRGSLGALVHLWEEQLSPSMRSGSRRLLDAESI